MDVAELSKSTDWGPYVDEILNLYRQGWKLKDLSTRMQKEYGLKKTYRQYKGLFNKHKVRKNQTAARWATVSRCVGARPGKRSEVFLDGVQIPEEKWKKEIERYAKSNHSITGVSLSENIIVRTPPPIQDPACDDDVGMIHREYQDIPINEETSTPWDLVVFATGQCQPPQSTSAYPDALSPLGTHHTWESISLPEEVMEEEDLGNLVVLTRKIHLRGIKLLDPSEENRFLHHMLEHRSSTPALIPERQLPNTHQRHNLPISRPLACDWTWESLFGMFEEFVANSSTKRLRLVLYGLPADLAALLRFTKTNILNCLVSVVMQFGSLFISMEDMAWAKRFQDWLWHPHNLGVLKLLLSSHNRPLTIAFAYNLFVHYAMIECELEEEQMDSISLKAMKTCVEFLSSPEQKLAASMKSDLIEWSARASKPEAVAAFLNASAGRSTKVPTFVLQDVSKLSLETVALFLSRGAPANVLLESATDAVSEQGASWSGDKTTKEYQLLLMSLARGADVDAITYTTFPLSIAEYFALHTPTWGHLLRDWSDDLVSREVIDIYRSACNPDVLRGCSSMGKEVALNGLVQHCVPDLRYDEPKDLTQIRSLLHCGTNPSLPTLFQNQHHELALRRWKPSQTEDRARFGFHHDESRLPVDICALYLNAEATQLLLEFGSPIAETLLQTFELCLSNSSNIAYSELTCHPQYDFVRHMSHYFVRSRRRADISRVRDFLLLWAIHREDETLVREQAADGVDLCRVRPSVWCTPFLDALKNRSLKFAKVIYDIQSEFHAAKDRRLGAYELVELCRYAVLKCDITSDSILERLTLLLDLGATINATYAWDGDVPLTPLQATLAAVCPRNTWQNDGTFGKALNMCTYLLERGANVNAPQSEAATPLQLAVVGRRKPMLELLLRYGANPDITRREPPERLWWATYHVSLRSPLMMVSCLESCSRSNLAEGSCGDENGISPASGPCERYQLTQSLLQADADINLPLENDSTLLVEVCWRGCLPTMELLLQHGADVNDRNKNGCHPLEAVMSRFDGSSNRIEMVFKLLDGGARLDERGPIDKLLWESLQSRDETRFEKRFTFLSRSESLCDYSYISYVGCKWRDMIGVEAILEAGADVNYVKHRKGKFTVPLTAAIRRQDLSGLLCLLDNGADVVDKGHSLINLAIGNNLYEITQVLYNAGARPSWGSDEFINALNSANYPYGGSVLALVQSWQQA